MSEIKKTVVTLKIGVDVDAFIAEMQNTGATTDFVPTRQVQVYNLKPSSLRNVDFLMTQEEAALLENDPRVISCRIGSKIENGFIISPAANPSPTLYRFTRSASYSATNNSDINWGLHDCYYQTNPFTSNNGTIIDQQKPYTLDGTGVDVIIQDSGLEINHPEFKDANGQPRVQIINWLGGASNVSNNIAYSGSGNRIVTFTHEPKSTPIPVGANVIIYNFYTPNSANVANTQNVKMLNINSISVTNSTSTTTTVTYPNNLDFTNISNANISPGIIGYFPNGNVTGLANFYTDTFGHGTNVGSIAAGKNYGWAKNANIYVMNILGTNPNSRISSAGVDDAGFNLIGAFHLSKPVDPSTGFRRPTIVNMSWVVSGPKLTYVDANNNIQQTPYIIKTSSGNVVLTFTANTLIHNGGSITNIGPISSTNIGNLQQYGMYPQYKVIKDYIKNVDSDVPPIIVPLDSTDADAADCIQNGVILVGAAGNESYKISTPSTSDYNNKITLDVKTYFGNNLLGQVDFNYLRGSSPTALTIDETMYLPNAARHVITAGPICVGAIDYTFNGSSTTGNYNVGNLNANPVQPLPTSKALFSCTGPRVDVYAPGGYIAGAFSNIGDPEGYPVAKYYDNADYMEAKISGTSQASPQVTGVMACVLQANPYFTQADAQAWIKQHSVPKVANTTATTTANSYNPYTDLFNLQGSPNNYLYMPYQTNVVGSINSGNASPSAAGNIIGGFNL